ncbi:metal ABC transporter substrate-binding protein [Chitiniphilus shinanonensis]|uniref:Metal ABC transporter substrate-binding protein n=1 Tax=Chitiniphilus shinanonensis TaxID=553088 RepID=F8WSS8_9NEIS|nr:metal ABC transporter substrate-binding protein [Chitiniphilus shinanonensis]BAK53915.1 periplasmic solute binding protein [Chitiniphilus shinanonensis]GLS05487.1 metal ABC transporter substrate-binding protein [Chitiniphilus shinanonensis]
MKTMQRLFGALALCAAAAVASAADRLPVVASFSILGDLVAQVGGERVSVTTLVGPDQDAHVFQPRPSDARTVAGARLLVVNGLGFEGWLDRLAASSGFRGTQVVLSQGIKPRRMAHDHDDHAAHDHDHDHGGIDPHAWQDPRNVVLYVNNLVRALSQADPAGAAVYRRNGDHYVAQLLELDRWAAAQFAKVPQPRRKVITSHDAFGYLAQRYDIRFLAPQGVSTEAEPSARDVAALIRQIKAERISAVFVENMSNPRTLQLLGSEAGVKPGPRLYADALSVRSGPAGSYLEMMRYNVRTIVAALAKP